jgi:hypothetical protein
VWAVPGRFFQSLPVPCGASPYVISPYVTDSREKKIRGNLIFWGKRFGRPEKKIFRPWTAHNHFYFFLYWPRLPFFFFSYCLSRLKGWMKCPSGLMTGRILGKTRKKKKLGLGQPKINFILFYFIFIFLYWPRLPFFSFRYCPSQLRGWMKCPSGLMTGWILGKLFFF